MNQAKQPSALSLQSISFAYPKGASVLRELSLEAQPNALTVLLGPSGCGKTTCLRLVAGLERPNRGRIQIGERLAAGSEAWIPPRGRDVGFCFQEFALWPQVRVQDQIALPLRQSKISPQERQQRVSQLLAQYHIAELADRMPHALSGGQQRRVALARALASQPSVLLLDEPFTSVEARLRATLLHELRNLRREPCVTLIVTHQREEAFALADQLLVMIDGTIERAGSPEVCFRDPQTKPVAQLLGYSIFLGEEALSIIDGVEAHKDDKLAAWMWDGLAAFPDPEGLAQVRDCWFAAPGYRVELEAAGSRLSASSLQPIAEGARVSVQAVQPPVWVIAS